MSKTNRRSAAICGVTLLLLLLTSALPAAVCSNPAQLSVSPSTVDFGEVETGQSAVQAVTVTNITALPVFVGGASTRLHTYFTGSAGDCPGLLDPGESCTFHVAFEPNVSGTYSNQSVVTTADQWSFEVALSGIGISPVLDLAASLPNGGESVTYSTQFTRKSKTLTWSYNAASSAQRTKLSYSTDGSTWTCIADSGDTDCSDGCCNTNIAGTDTLAPGDTNFLWTLPSQAEATADGQTLPSSSAKVRVEVENGGANPLVDESDQDFHLVDFWDAYGTETLILWHSERMEEKYGSAATTSLATKLGVLAADSDIDGMVLDLSLSTEVQVAYTAWDDNFNQTIDTANGLAGAVRRYIHDQLDVFDNAEYLILVGDDYQIPFYRMPDGTYLPESAYGAVTSSSSIGSSQSSDYYFTDNFYSEDDPQPGRGNESIYLNDYFIGRLVETPQQIEGVIDAFQAENGDRTLSSALVIANDFLHDGSEVIKETFQNAGKVTDCLLDDPDNATTSIACTQPGSNEEFTPAEMETSLFAPSLDLISINTHANHIAFAAQNALVGQQDGLCTVPGYQPTTCFPGGLDANPNSLAGSVIYSTGCHSGLPVPAEEPFSVDLPETLAKKGVVAYIGNTGYGWGLINGIGLSESLATLMTEEFVENGSISVGEALATAKNTYFSEIGGYDAYDEKILHEFTLYGIPNYVVVGGGPKSAGNTGSSRVLKSQSADPYSRSYGCQDGICIEEEAPQRAPEKGFFGVTILGIGFSFGPGVYQQFSTSDGDYYTLNGLASGDAGKAIQPRLIYDSHLSGTDPRGVIFDGGDYSLISPSDPVVGTPRTTEDDNFSEAAIPQRQTIQPIMTDICDMPLFSRLVIDTGYHTDSDTQALFDSVHVTRYYSKSIDRTGPSFTNPGLLGFHTMSGSTANFSVEVNDPAGMGKVLVTYDQPTLQEWDSIELTYNATTDKWQGSLATTETYYYFVQAVDSNGNVTVWSKTYIDPYGNARTEPSIFPTLTTFEYASPTWILGTAPNSITIFDLFTGLKTLACPATGTLGIFCAAVVPGDTAGFGGFAPAALTFAQVDQGAPPATPSWLIPNGCIESITPLGSYEILAVDDGAGATLELFCNRDAGGVLGRFCSLLDVGDCAHFQGGIFSSDTDHPNEHKVGMILAFE